MRATIPVALFLFCSGPLAIGFFLIGAAITLFTGRNMWLSGSWQVLFGLVAAAITFGIEKLIGVAVG